MALTERANAILQSSSPPAQNEHEAETAERDQGGRTSRLASWSSTDEHLFRDLMDRFTILAETCARFSQEVYRRSGTVLDSEIEATVRRNLKIARTIFARWSMDILAVIYLTRSIGFPELKASLGRISSSVLRSKLRQLEEMGLIQREDLSKPSVERRYSLTHKGLMIARLGEPVFLYLRLSSGWRNPPPTEKEVEELVGRPTTATVD